MKAGVADLVPGAQRGRCPTEQQALSTSDSVPETGVLGAGDGACHPRGSFWPPASSWTTDPSAGPPKVVPCHRDWLLLCSTELRSGIRFQIPTPRAAKHGNRDPFLSWRQLGSSQAPKGTLRRSWHPSFWGNGPNTFFGNESQLHGVCALGAGFGSLGHGLTRGLSCA